MAKDVPMSEIQDILEDKQISEITTYDVIRGLNNGNKFAKEVHNLWEEYLAMGIASLVNIFEPESIILSGGMAKFVNYEELTAKVQERIVNRKPQILSAKYDNAAGTLGAAYLAADKFFN